MSRNEPYRGIAFVPFVSGYLFISTKTRNREMNYGGWQAERAQHASGVAVDGPAKELTAKAAPGL
jgi:hypothetical protein